MDRKKKSSAAHINALSDFFPGFGFRVQVSGFGFKVSGFGFCKLLVFFKSMTMLKRGLRTL